MNLGRRGIPLDDWNLVSGGTPVNTIFEIPNWKGRNIQVARSGEQFNGRMAVVDFKDNLVAAAIPECIPFPLLQKLVRSVHEADYFGAARTAVTNLLDFYTDLQSLASEDAITFSYFGPIWLRGSTEVARFTDWLVRELELPLRKTATANMEFWRRIPHAQTAGRNGSEFDWAVQSANLLLFSENEFCGSHASNLGIRCDLSQVEMLREYVIKWGAALHPSVERFVILYITPFALAQSAVQEDFPIGRAWLHIRNLTWQHLSSYRGHPLGTEFGEYFDWRCAHAELSVPNPLPAIPG